MKYCVLSICFLFIMITSQTACNIDLSEYETTPHSGQEAINKIDTMSKVVKIQIKIGAHTFFANLQDNPTAQAFSKLLPLELDMDELNKNEKYADLPSHLPTDDYKPITIKNGDLMLYTTKTLVLFYKTFNSNYHYTKIGQIDNPSELLAAVGTSNVKVSFELLE